MREKYLLLYLFTELPKRRLRTDHPLFSIQQDLCAIHNQMQHQLHHLHQCQVPQQACRLSRNNYSLVHLHHPSLLSLLLLVIPASLLHNFIKLNLAGDVGIHVKHHKPPPMMIFPLGHPRKTLKVLKSKKTQRWQYEKLMGSGAAEHQKKETERVSKIYYEKKKFGQ